MLSERWQSTVDATTNETIRRSLISLADGHRRFLSGEPLAHAYTQPELVEIATKQHPIAAIVACSDSRVAPEIIFDQPLGGIFASRVPGNVASDSAKWMLELAVAELKVPVVLVLGHTGCLAIGSMLNGQMGSAGGALRLDVQKAIHRARVKNEAELYQTAIEENVRLTMENLHRESYAVQKAEAAGTVALLGGYYEMKTGQVHLL